MGYASGHPLRLVSGRLSLDFVNTADWSAAGEIVHEKLGTPADLVIWRQAARIIEDDPVPSIEEVHVLRSRLRAALLEGRNASDPWPAARRVSELAGEGAGLRASVSLAALSLLLDPGERQRLKMCEGDDCGWLFMDETAIGRRRWCSMDTCGNRMKARRHYDRRRALGPKTRSSPRLQS